MITKTARQLVEIDRKIRILKLSALGGQIPHSLANEEIHLLEDERERLWAKAKE